MTNPEYESNRTQNIALALIVLAIFALALGEWKNWIHLVDFANTFGGGGVGILTGQKLQQNKQETNTGDIVNTPESTEKPPV